VHVHGRAVRDAAGALLRMAGCTTDIDDRKRAEDALRESQERYALAMTGSRGGHWVWDVARDQLFASRTLYELLGLPLDTPPGKGSDFLARVRLHPDDRDRVLKLIEHSVQRREARTDYECRILLPDDSVRWILNRAQRFSDEQGTRIAGVSVDITERKQAEDQRERLEQQLRQAQKLEAIGTLAGGIAHDFNNILSAILGYGELALKGAAEGSAQRRHIDAALAAGQRAKSLVERILAFSRSGVGERVPVHVQSVVAEALDGVAATLPAGVSLERHLAAGDAAVQGDATQISQPQALDHRLPRPAGMRPAQAATIPRYGAILGPMRKILSSVILSMLLLLVQQGAMLHQLSHHGASATQPYGDDHEAPLAAADPCGACLAFSAAGVAVAPHIAAPASPIASTVAPGRRLAALAAAGDWPFPHSRGPPAAL
jgi:PAS domain S-box-containing protein